MPYLFIYLLKLSISLSVVFLFYQLVLRKLTFYNWNRWYLLGYSALSFFIACYNITPLFQTKFSNYSEAIRLVPTLNFDHPDVSTGQIPSNSNVHEFGFWNWTALAIVVGIVIFSIRLLIQYLSFLRIRGRAQLLSTTHTRIYHVESDIIPFSFGNSIFINQQLHSREEMQEIVRHEFVHVKQKHSFDILWSEFVCIINWYNPFCWLLKKAIRENLEFIADNNVLANGANRKEYQYLLLKVIGNTHFSIAPKFNFSSLKKRIAMMNKMKTGRMHMIKFLFVLPVAVLSLIAFRTKDLRIKLAFRPPEASSQYLATALVNVSDTTPVKASKKPTKTIHNDYKIEITDGQAKVRMSDGKTEEYDLTDSTQRVNFETKYGKIITVPPPPEAKAITIVSSNEESVSASSSAGIETIVSPKQTVAVNAKTTTSAKTVISVKPAIATTIAPIAAVDDVLVVDENGNSVPREEHDLATITKSTTAEQIEELKKQLTEQGYDLTIDNTTYNNKGILTHINGRIRSKEAVNSFSATEFEKLILTRVTVNTKSYIMVTIKDKPKRVI